MTSTTITLAQETLAGIPCLHAAPAQRAHEALPTVFFLHGFNTSSKEITSYFGTMLAMAGLRVVLPEADGHGARFDGNGAARLLRFWDILKTTIDELPSLRDACEARGWIDSGRIGVGGTSMGGFVTLGALARYPWIRAAAAYMGSGYYLDLSRTLFPPLGRHDATIAAEHDRRMATLADYDVGQRLAQLGDRPLLLWHGQRDDVVPFEETARLYADLQALGLADSVELVVDPSAVHRITDASARAGVHFFRRHL